MGLVELNLENISEVLLLLSLATEKNVLNGQGAE